MGTREASCSCGRLRLEADGDPVRISICHCLACQRRTGSAFGAQARFPAAAVRITGRSSAYTRSSDEAGEGRTFSFCPECGATVFYTTEHAPDTIAVPIGAFADPHFPQPTVAVFSNRKHPWVLLAAEIDTDEAWEELRPLYEAGRYAEAADRGEELLAAQPRNAELLYNIACCESLAGRPDAALAHLRRALERSSELRQQVPEDTDLDPLRGEPGYAQLLEATG